MTTKKETAKETDAKSVEVKEEPKVPEIAVLHSHMTALNNRLGVKSLTTKERDAQKVLEQAEEARKITLPKPYIPVETPNPNNLRSAKSVEAKKESVAEEGPKLSPHVDLSKTLHDQQTAKNASAKPEEKPAGTEATAPVAPAAGWGKIG